MIHQIWVGDTSVNTILQNTNSVKNMNNMLEYRLYTNKDLSEFGLNSCLGKYHPVFISNILRIKVLYKYGGWYIDADTIAYKPLSKIDIDFNKYDIYMVEQEFRSKFNKDVIHYDSGFVYAKQGYDFGILNDYDMLGPLFPHWEKFFKDKEFGHIDKKYFSNKSTFMKHLEYGSWK
jgi:hypothetical protein